MAHIHNIYTTTKSIERKTGHCQRDDESVSNEIVNSHRTELRSVNRELVDSRNIMEKSRLERARYDL